MKHNTHTHKRTHTHTHTRESTHTHTRESTHTHTHTHTNEHIHTHTHTHMTQKQHTHIQHQTHTQHRSKLGESLARLAVAGLPCLHFILLPLFISVTSLAHSLLFTVFLRRAAALCFSPVEGGGHTTCVGGL